MTAGVEIRYTPEATPSAFHACDDFCRGILGPVGSGKSVACTLEMFMRACRQRPIRDMKGRYVRKSRWAAIRNTYPELKTTTIKTFQDWFPPEIAKFKWDIPITSTIEIRLGDGTWVHAEVVFIAMDRPQDVNKLKSLELTGAWLNEAVELPKAALDMATSRVGRYPGKREGGPSWRGIIMDTNPPDDDHWYYTMAEEEKPQVKLPSGEVLKYSFFRQPPALLDDGRGGYIPNPDAENVKNLEGGFDYYFQQIPGKTREWLRVFVQGQYGTVHDGKRVYPEYSDGDHCALHDLIVTPGLPILLGWDFGLTPACVIAQYNPRGRLEVIEELVAEEMGIRQFAHEVVKPHLLNEYAGIHIGASIGDPAGNQRSQQSQELTCIKELRLAGLPTEPAVTNEFVARREAVAGLLRRRDGFVLSPKCKSLRKGFNGGYKFERVQVAGDERFKDVPSKNRYSHPHDALQYIALHIEDSILRKMRRSYRRNIQHASAAGWT